MPELPEVETVVRDLRPLAVGREVRHVRVGRRKLRRPWKATWNRHLMGARVARIDRRGKWIRIGFTNGSVLIVHLGMTGQLTVADADTKRSDHTHLVFEFDDDQELRFRDVRRFGSADVFASADEADRFLTDRLGPEPFDLTPAEFRTALRGSARCLKALLLDQAVIAGVGNIYADEAGFLAGLHPARRGRSLSDIECDRLLGAIVDVLNRAITGRGSTIRDYVGGSGLIGTYQGEFRVYGRAGEPCPACASAVEMTRLAGRSSHYCPRCQPRNPSARRPAGK